MEASHDLLELLYRSPPPKFKDATGVGMVVRTGQTLFVPDLKALDRGSQLLDATERQRLDELDARSFILVPLRARAHLLVTVPLYMRFDPWKEVAR